MPRSLNHGVMYVCTYIGTEPCLDGNRPAGGGAALHTDPDRAVWGGRMCLPSVTVPQPRRMFRPSARSLGIGSLNPGAGASARRGTSEAPIQRASSTRAGNRARRGPSEHSKAQHHSMVVFSRSCPLQTWLRRCSCLWSVNRTPVGNWLATLDDLRVASTLLAVHESCSLASRRPPTAKQSSPGPLLVLSVFHLAVQQHQIFV